MTKKNVARSWGGGSRFTDPAFIAYFVVFRGEIFYTVLDEEQETFFFFFFKFIDDTCNIWTKSGFYFERTFHALPSRPVFLIRSREDPTSLSLSRSFRIKQEKLSNRRLTTNKIISTLVPSLVQGEERERERRKERKKEGRETKGTNDLQTQKDHESLALSRTLEIHPRGLHNHIF